MKKRVFSALLALVLTLSAVVLPASAAGSFSDVSDKKTAQNVEVLRLLGVVEGNGIGQFNPYAQLTRAEFCKMLVTLMGSSDVLRYKTVTIFPDVRASHWAARYVNYAVRGEKLLSGMPDGTFQPDRAISYGEAVTILMRLLRTDADAASGGTCQGLRRERGRGARRRRGHFPRAGGAAVRQCARREGDEQQHR